MGKFLPNRKLTYYEWRLLPGAFFELTAARFKVSFLPGRKWSLRTNSDKPDVISNINRNSETENPEVIARLIESLALRLPWKSACLVNVLAAHRILKRRGIEHKVHFGVKKNKADNLEAHAWLSVRDEVILGGGNLYDFHEMKPFNTKTRC